MHRYRVRSGVGVFLGDFRTRWGARRALRKWAQVMSVYPERHVIIARDSRTGEEIGRG